MAQARVDDARAMRAAARRAAEAGRPEPLHVRFQAVALAALRVIAGGMIMQHGVQKLFGALGGVGGSGAHAPFVSQLGVGGAIELVGGICLLLGAVTRPAALLLSGTMAVAYLQRHAPNGFWPIVNQGELAALYCFVFLAFAVLGGGPFSVDAVRGSRRR